MRKLLIPLVLFVLVIAKTTTGAASDYVWLMEDTFAIELPKGWSHEVSDDRQHITVTHPDYDNCALLFTTPNPTFTGGKERYLGGNFLLIFTGLDKQGKVLGENEAEFDDKYPAVRAIFAIPDGEDPEYVGVGQAVDFNGYLVAMIAFGETAQMDSFIDKAVPIIDSYIFDEEDAKEQKKLLEEIGKGLTRYITLLLEKE